MTYHVDMRNWNGRSLRPFHRLDEHASPGVSFIITSAQSLEYQTRLLDLSPASPDYARQLHIRG